MISDPFRYMMRGSLGPGVEIRLHFTFPVEK